MIRYAGIDYGFRPENYWDDEDLLQSLLRNVKGENRRQMIIDYFEEDRVDELAQALLSDELDEDTRNRLGRIHPSFMGGEYLPDYLPGEVEIARICLQSTTSDVISVRARPTATGMIAYRVVDEYQEEFVLPLEESTAPLTLAELVRQLDEGTMKSGDLPAGGLSLGYNNMNAETDRFEELRHFTSIHSTIYRQLNAHYEEVFDDWVELGVAYLQERDRPTDEDRRGTGSN